MAPSIGSEELAEGLMLVRASTLKMIRFQLAMERRDRRVALEEVDELLELDRRLQDFVGDVPALNQMALRRELEVERAALNREKLTLAAEVIRRENAPAAAESQVEDPPAEVVEAPDMAVWGSFEFVEAEKHRHTRAIRWLALILVLLSALAGAAYVLTDPQMLASLAAQIGAVQ